MALSKDEQRTLDEIERALRDEKPCFKDCQAKRYLPSAQLKKLGKVLRFVLQDGDAHAGQACVECDEPCSIGDEVAATEVALRHAKHHDEVEAKHHGDVENSMGLTDGASDHRSDGPEAVGG